jgi:hypothetical protein
MTANVTRLSANLPVGTIGEVGRVGNRGIVLSTMDGDGNTGAAWFTFEQVEAMGLMCVPVSEIVVRVENRNLGMAVA